MGSNPIDKLTKPSVYKYYRKMIGTQADVAGALSIHRRTIISREKGQTPITREAGLAIRELARVVGYELDEL